MTNIFLHFNKKKQEIVFNLSIDIVNESAIAVYLFILFLGTSSVFFLTLSTRISIEKWIDG